MNNIYDERAEAIRGIETRLELRKLTRAPARRWPAIAASLLFFGLVAFFGLHQFGGRETVELASTQQSFIQDDPQTIYWRVQILGDNQELSLHVHKVHDLPAGGKRLMQKVHGYDATIVSGRITFREGQATGELPGKLVRGQQAELAA